MNISKRGGSIKEGYPKNAGFFHRESQSKIRMMTGGSPYKKDISLNAGFSIARKPPRGKSSAKIFSWNQLAWPQQFKNHQSAGDGAMRIHLFSSITNLVNKTYPTVNVQKDVEHP